MTDSVTKRNQQEEKLAQSERGSQTQENNKRQEKLKTLKNQKNESTRDTRGEGIARQQNRESLNLNGKLKVNSGQNLTKFRRKLTKGIKLNSNFVIFHSVFPHKCCVNESSDILGMK